MRLTRLLAPLLLLSLPPLPAAAAEKQPNLLLLFADDQCFDTLRSLGNEEIETPNLDRLVRRGATFTHAYNQGGWSGAVCVASRTMLNTGRFLWHAHAVSGSMEQERKGGRVWSEQLKRAGYRTYMTGKWHVSLNASAAFDVAANVRGGMPNQTPEGYNRPIEGKPDPWSPYDPKFGGFWKGGKHWSEVVADDALDFLHQAAGDARPYFMYIAFNAPHDPRQSPRQFVEKYPLEKIGVPENFLAEYPHKDAIGCGKNLRDEALAPFPRTEYAVKVNRQEYYAIITHMDQQIGRILDALEASGEGENTYIMFTADHGLAVGQHGLLGKQNMFDHSVRVPLVVAGPGIKAGEKIETPVYYQDIVPTTLELAGAEPAEHVEFRSLLPLLRGERAEQYEAIYGAYLDVQRMVTHDGWKLILYPKNKTVLLYHLTEDPREMHNLADRPEHAERIRGLFARLLTLQEQTGDKLSLKTAFPEL